MNEFRLTPLEIKNMKRDIEDLVSQRTLPISYYESDYTPGYSENTSNWSDYSDYKCGVQEVDKTTINRFNYGDIKEGDIILYLSYNTTLPETDKYRIKYNNIIYTSDNSYFPKQFLDATILYYLLIGRR